MTESVYAEDRVDAFGASMRRLIYGFRERLLSKMP